MYRGPANAEDGRDCLLTWASVFEKASWSTGGAEVCSTLQNISDFKQFMTGEVELYLRKALKGSGILIDKEIMDDIRSTRKGFSRQDWWWYPEKIR